MGAMSSYPVRTRRWTRKEYDRLIDLGILHEDEPIELLAGQMLVAEPKTPLDSTAIGLAGDALRVAFGDGWLVCTHNPIALDDESEPEPDVMVVAGQIRDYRDAHPERAALVVEVALSSLAFDRRHKGSLYARAGVADYWIVNLSTSARASWRCAADQHPIQAPISAPRIKISSSRGRGRR